MCVFTLATKTRAARKHGAIGAWKPTKSERTTPTNRTWSNEHPGTPGIRTQCNKGAEESACNASHADLCAPESASKGLGQEHDSERHAGAHCHRAAALTLARVGYLLAPAPAHVSPRNASNAGTNENAESQ